MDLFKHWRFNWTTLSPSCSFNWSSAVAVISGGGQGAADRDSSVKHGMLVVQKNWIRTSLQICVKQTCQSSHQPFLWPLGDTGVTWPQAPCLPDLPPSPELLIRRDWFAGLGFWVWWLYATFDDDDDDDDDDDGDDDDDDDGGGGDDGDGDDDNYIDVPHQALRCVMCQCWRVGLKCCQHVPDFLTPWQEGGRNVWGLGRKMWRLKLTRWFSCRDLFLCVWYVRNLWLEDWTNNQPLPREFWHPRHPKITEVCLLTFRECLQLGRTKKCLGAWRSHGGLEIQHGISPVMASSTRHGTSCRCKEWHATGIVASDLRSFGKDIGKIERVGGGNRTLTKQLLSEFQRWLWWLLLQIKKPTEWWLLDASSRFFETMLEIGYIPAEQSTTYQWDMTCLGGWKEGSDLREKGWTSMNPRSQSQWDKSQMVHLPPQWHGGYLAIFIMYSCGLEKILVSWCFFFRIWGKNGDVNFTELLVDL